jgi:hypothetical protein
MNELRQTDFEPETGLPRWGCMIMAFTVAAWRRAMGRDPEPAEVLRLLADAQTRPAPWAAGKTVITNAGQRGNWELMLWDPSVLLDIALGYADGGGWHGAQFPDLRTVHPAYVASWGKVPDVVAAMPSDYGELAGVLVNHWRPDSNDGHWVLCDPRGLSITYDPDPSLGIDGWRRTGAWRGVRIWKE